MRLALGFCTALVLVGSGLAAQIHVADFSRSDSPNGLSRRGYFGTPGADQSPACAELGYPFEAYTHGTTDWSQNFWGGHYWVTNPNAARFQCADLGVGRGGDVLPAPLVAGGAFVTEPLDGFAPDFGPYALPFTFRVELPDLGEAFAASSYAGPVHPAFPAGDFRSIGVTLLVDNREGLRSRERARAVTAGLRFDAGVAQPVLDVYEASFASLLADGPVALGAGATNVPWSLEVTVRRGSIELNVVVDGVPASPAPLQALFANSPSGGAVRAWNVQRVRAAALRVAGFVTPTAGGLVPLRVARIEVASPNVPAFEGPPSVEPLPAPPVAEGPILARDGAHLMLDGPLRATGVCSPWLLDFFAGLDATADYGRHVVRSLAAASPHRVIRFSCSGMFSTYVRDRSAAYPGWPATNFPLLELFEQDPGAYFIAFDQLVAVAEESGVYLVPSLLWSAAIPYAHAHGVKLADVTPAQIVGTFRDPEPGEEASPETDLVQRFVRAVVERYRDHPHVLFWEIGNEWDLKLDHGYLAFPARSSQPVWWPTPTELVSALDFVARTIRERDAVHLIATGFGGVADRVENGAMGPACSSGVAGCQSAEAMACAMAELQPQSIDLLSLHNYETEDPAVNPGCTGWNPRPFADWEDYYAFVGATLPNLYPASSDPARAVYVGEHNFKAFNSSVPCGDRPYLEGVHRAMLASAFGNEALGIPPRVQLVLTWRWMSVPHAAFADRHDFGPDTLAKTVAEASEHEKSHVVFAELARRWAQGVRLAPAGLTGTEPKTRDL